MLSHHFAMFCFSTVEPAQLRAQAARRNNIWMRRQWPEVRRFYILV